MQHLYAEMFGYFWLPCSLCGKNFGGHEWLPGNNLYHNGTLGEGVCPNCGDKARELNAKNAIDESGFRSNPQNSTRV